LIEIWCALVLCAAALVGLSTANRQYGGVRYSGQQMPVSYYLPSKMYTGHQQMYVPQYYQPQVAAAYPVRHTPAYQVRPMVVSNQVEEVPMINVDMDFSPTFTYPGAVHGGDKQTSGAMHGGGKQTSFASRSGSVSSTDSCKADKLKHEASMRLNLKTLTNIHNANLTSLDIEKIFGPDFQSRSSGSSCNTWKGISCSASIGFAIPGCITAFTNPGSLAACVGGIVGAGNDCLPCVCFLAEKIADVPGCGGNSCSGGDSCCTSTNKCGVGEGDCDSDSDCQSGLVCGVDNCSGSGFDSTDDCCYRPCTGGDSCCTSTNKCGVGEGDCDSDSDCWPGLVCGVDNCSGPGFDSTDDCCYRADPCTGGDTCCTPISKCGAGEGDCDSDSDCQPGLVCGIDNCSGPGFDSTDDCCFRP